MDRPKATQNSSTGMDVSSGPGRKPSTPERCPSWKIQTAAPSTAVSDSALSTNALIGITTLPVNRKRSTNVASEINPMASGNRAAMVCFPSTRAADGPPTSTDVPAGAGRARTALTRSWPAPDAGSTEGTTSR